MALYTHSKLVQCSTHQQSCCVKPQLGLIPTSPFLTSSRSNPLAPPTPGRQLVARSKGPSLGDDLLDFALAGRKLRRWYGAPPRRTGNEDDEDEEGGEQPPEPPQDPEGQQEQQELEEGDAVVVTDGDSRMGEQLVLQLILARANIRAFVRDMQAARNAYGPYITPVSCDIGSSNGMLKRALAGCHTLVCLGAVPNALLQTAQQAGVQHVVLLSAAGTGQSAGLLSVFDRELSDLKEPAREAAVTRAGLPCTTIVRVAAWKDAPGGKASIKLVPADAGSSATGGPVSKEDLARVIVEALNQPPSTPTRTFQVVSVTPGTPPEDWGRLLETLQPSTSAA